MPKRLQFTLLLNKKVIQQNIKIIIISFRNIYIIISC